MMGFIKQENVNITHSTSFRNLIIILPIYKKILGLFLLLTLSLFFPIKFVCLNLPQKSGFPELHVKESL